MHDWQLTRVRVTCPGYWAVGAEEETAMNGVWKKGPARDLFDALEQARTWSPVSDVLSPGSVAWHICGLMFSTLPTNLVLLLRMRGDGAACPSQ